MKKLELLQQKNAYQQKKNRLYIIIAIVAGIGVVLLFFAYHFKVKYAVQEEQLHVEEKERLEAEQELMESEKEQLQKELLAGAMQVEHKNEVLNQLKEKLHEQAETLSPKTIDRLINAEMRADSDFGHLKTEFQEIHPDFFNRLQAQALKKLTRLDLKYCTYFYMKLDSKQIANLLNVAPKSVRMAKYRLKKKLGLAKADDLDHFLEVLVEG